MVKGKFWVPTVTVLRYRLKGETMLYVVVVQTLDVQAPPTAWNAEGKATAWRVVLHVNGWWDFPVHEMTDWHCFETVDAKAFAAENGTMREAA